MATNLLESAVAPMRPLFAERSVRLELECATELPILNVDGEQIFRVLTNLLDNALKFTAPSGRIRLSAVAVAGGVRFSIANSGEALPTETLEAMFQPFWQAARQVGAAWVSALRSVAPS